jgi:hypothetical protein
MVLPVKLNKKLKALAGLSYHYSTINTTEKGDPDVLIYGLSGPSSRSDPDKTTHSMFYRQHTQLIQLIRTEAAHEKRQTTTNGIDHADASIKHPPELN